MAASKKLVPPHDQTFGQAFVIAEIGSSGTPTRARADEVLKYIIEPVPRNFTSSQYGRIATRPPVR